jgi:hypothetical protein
MIAVTLEGRLGNQLFQYAFIYSAAKKLNTRFYLDKSVDYLLLDKYFHIENDFCWYFDNYIFSIKGFKNIFSHHLRYKFYSVLKSIFNLKEMTIDSYNDPAIQIKSVKNNIIYNGFFQSEEYFKESGGQIHNLFKIKEIYKTEFEKIINNACLPPNYVVVHIRRKDYIDLNFALGYEYFHKAIKSIHKEENYYVFISDEPGIIEHEFNYIKHKYISFNNEIIDFQFIKNADICILSNSSFSWWGAWLNIKQPKIIAPEYWLGNDYKKELPVNIIPSSWFKFAHS